MNLTKPSQGDTNWTSPVNQNWTDIENALTYGAGLTFQSSTPTQITTDQNDYGFSGGDATYTFQRLSSSSVRNITGFSGGANGRLLVLRNVGSFDITIANQSASSSSANRVITRAGDTIILSPNATILLIYDGTTQRWQEVGGNKSVAEIQWEFAGTLSTDQNLNFGRYRAKSPITLRHFDVNLVIAGTGGSTTIVFKVNGATVATIGVSAGNREATVDATVSLSPGDELWPEISAVASTLPPVTGVFSARS